MGRGRALTSQQPGGGLIAADTVSLMHGARRAFIVRAVTLPVAGVAGLLAARVTVTHLGVGGFAVFALVVGLAAMIPIGDLGVGAAVTDAVARREELGTEGVYQVMRTSLRVLAPVSAGVTALAWVLAALGAWAPLLGVTSSTEVELATATALSLFALGIPLSLSNRVLLGAERNDIALLLQGGSSVAALLIVLLAAAANAPLWAYVGAPAAGTALAATGGWRMARRVADVSLTASVRSAIRGHRGARIAHLAGPMLVITVALPIAYQSDRLLLSHLSTLGELAVYAVGLQVFAPLLGLVAAAGMTLWPIFARRRASRPVSYRELMRLSAAFTSVGVLLGAAMVVAGPWVAQLVSKGSIDVSRGVFAAFALLLIVHASYFPTGMLLTDRDGLRFQAVTSAVMMVVNVLASALLASHIGAAGPILGSVGAIVLAMWIPGVWRAFTSVQN